MLQDIELYDWQKECLEKWTCNNCGGVVNVATGAGKTILAAAAVKLLEQRLSAYGGQLGLKVKIIVPKIFLTAQWLNVLTQTLGAKRWEIGLYYGGFKEAVTRKYMIYVLNSARYTVSSHIMEDFNSGYNVFLICDECHHFGSEENIKVFSFYPHIDKSRYYSMGLSATPETGNPILTEALGGEIYKYGINSAVRTGVVADYNVFNISAEFLPHEADEYNALTERLGRYYTKLFKLKPQLKALRKSRFYAELNALAGKGGGEISNCASGILNTLIKRKEIVYLSGNRISCVIELIKRLPPDSRIIVFGERVAAVEELYGKLKGTDACKYHSGLNENARRINLERYENGEQNILLSCRALDEGLNIPDTNIGILMSSTGSVRQRIQRIGRVLRKNKDSGTKTVYYLHIEDTEEDEILPAEHFDSEGNYILTFNLRYSAEKNEFIHEEYDTLCCYALNRLAEKNTPSELIDEVCRNFKLGSVRGDWLLSEAECRAEIRKCKTTAERNYLIAMLKLIQANQSTRESSDTADSS